MGKETLFGTDLPKSVGEGEAVRVTLNIPDKANFSSRLVYLSHFWIDVFCSFVLFCCCFVLVLFY